LLQVTPTVPIVFTYAADPVGAGFADSLARPGGTATGFMSGEYSIGGKWLELLKQIAPSVTRVAVLRNSNIPTGPAQFGIIQAVAQSLSVEVNPLNLRDGAASSIEYIKAGKLRALAVTTATRSDVLPNIPTLSEFVPGYETNDFFGVGAPKNTPIEIVDRLNKEINAALADPKIKARLADLGASVLSGSPADFGKLIADETEKWAKVIRAANIKVE
jgi:hypothetical protein